MVTDKRETGDLEFDEELESLWRKGLSDGQYDRVQGLIAAEGKVEPPVGLESKLLKIGSTEPRRATSEQRFWGMPSFKYVPVTILFAAMILGAYYFEFHQLPFSKSSSAQISAKADRFLEGIIEDGSATDIFDRDISVLERLS